MSELNVKKDKQYQVKMIDQTEGQDCEFTALVTEVKNADGTLYFVLKVVPPTETA